ncbi:MAG: polysulfide reductase [Deltaproteobacteria bacterium]|nr:MAG: polysulfide reductase [Deltaproteobacteria bacterium]
MNNNDSKSLFTFFRDILRWSTQGSLRYHMWMGCLTFVMAFGAFAYIHQVRHGLGVTGMNDYVNWGLYISNFTFLVGIAAAAVMLVLPAYILHDVDFSRAVLIGEGLAVTALLMCLAFVTVDLGGPHRIWHMMPVVGYFNWPMSMLAWDVIVLNGYLMLNLLIPFYILYSHYKGKKPDPKKYLPFVILSVFWAVSIHMVTAFLYAGLPSRPYWNNALLGPRFLASAFAGGPALMIVILSFIHEHTAFKIGSQTIRKLALIVTIAAQINLVMLGSELFKEFYSPTHHSASATYLFFGLKGYNSLVPVIWTAIFLNVIATLLFTFHRTRQNKSTLLLASLLLFVAIWLEKGMGLVVPGFIPSPLGEIVEYFPSWVEIAVTGGIWAMGCFVFTLLIKAALHIELQYDAASK